MIGTLLRQALVQITTGYAHLAADPLKAAAEQVLAVTATSIFTERSEKAAAAGRQRPRRSFLVLALVPISAHSMRDSTYSMRKVECQARHWAEIACSAATASFQSAAVGSDGMFSTSSAKSAAARCMPSPISRNSTGR